MKKTVIGIMAHVDAGKTTLSEAMLYTAGAIDKLGRVDKRDAFLDTHSVERERGITVFSKQAHFELKETEVTLIDTPGHIDFGPEAVRSIAVQDYAILVISATEGVVPHAMTLWNYLTAKRVPTFIFVNKTDIAEKRRIDLLSQLRSAFGSSVCDFNLEGEDRARFLEECAACDETLMESFFTTEDIPHERLQEAIRARKVIPAIFGSALKCRSVDLLLSLIDRYTLPQRYSNTIFGARVFKIETAPDGARLTHVKITGGALMPKDTVRIIGTRGEVYEEKIESIRQYSSEKFKLLKRAEAADVCTLVGLSKTRTGMGLGVEADENSELAPVLDYSIIFADPKTDVYAAYLKLKIIGEEEPSLAMRYDKDTNEIRVRLMGPIQTEVLTRIVKDRFGIDISFDRGAILYKETVAEKVYGAGHFEPLMHYAEVRLRIEPLPLGSGTVFTTDCPEDRLRRNWQRLILSHLYERQHRGVLTGSPLTDVKVTLIAGRAHPKHTEGGDFREATFRALRQGLMKAECVLLEPTFDFTVTLPEEYVGRLMTDITNMHGEYDPPEFENGEATVMGSCPVYTMHSYANDLRAYTHGKGKITLTVGEYMPCHNSEQIIAARAYAPEGDTDVTADSVFCKGGSGYLVPWYEADEKMHTDNPEYNGEKSDTPPEESKKRSGGSAASYRGTVEEDRELMRIFEATYGKIKVRRAPERVVNSAEGEKPKRRKPKPRGDDYVVVDGYNLIYASNELSQLAKEDLSHARDTLIHILSNYRAFTKCRLILVFDAYKRRDNEGSVEECGGITVVYTKERETADAYIEKATYSLAERNSVRVVTSDYVEQLIVLGNGATRVSAREFLMELDSAATSIREIIDN